VFRRDFLKAFAAAASAAFSGGAAAAAVGTTVAKSAPPAKQATLASRTPQIAVSANTSQFSQQIDTIRQMLGECRLVKIEEMSLRDGGYTITASYRHDPNGTPTDLDKQWGEYLVNASIRSVQVSESCEEIDVFHLGSYRYADTLKPVRDITVEYVKGW
jgi:hypothetical protein